MSLRFVCNRCGRIERLLAPASKAFSVADGLLHAPCPGGSGNGFRCSSFDRRVDLRIEHSL